jgi:CRISPR-associated protein Csm5
MTHTLYFHTLSPVSIGTGEKLSPYSDFVLHNKQIHILDLKKIQDHFKNKSDSLIDEYVVGVVSGLDIRSQPFELISFLKTRLSADLQDISLQIYPTDLNEGKVQLYQIIKTPSYQPFFPGSSLKGAFKTALLYNWLKNDPDGKTWIKDFVNIFSNEKKRNEQVNKLDEQYEKYKIAITDSKPLPAEAIRVYKAIRFHLKDNQNKIPQIWEAIVPNAKTEAQFRSETIDTSSLLGALKQFSRDANQRDIELLQTANGSNLKLQEFYEQISTQMQAGEICFKVGSGKGYFFNSVGLAIYNYENGKYFSEFLKTFPQAQKIGNGQSFPITKVVDEHSQVPWGWVQISANPIEKQESIYKKSELKSNKSVAYQSIGKKINYLKPGTKLKSGLQIDALVIENTPVNRLKLYISPTEEPIIDIPSYKSALPLNGVVIVKINDFVKGKIKSIGFVDFKK